MRPVTRVNDDNGKVTRTHVIGHTRCGKYGYSTSSEEQGIVAAEQNYTALIRRRRARERSTDPLPERPQGATGGARPC